MKGVTENTDDWQLTADVRVSGTVGWGGDKGKPRPCPPVAAVLQQQLTGDRPEWVSLAATRPSALQETPRVWIVF